MAQAVLVHGARRRSAVPDTRYLCHLRGQRLVAGLFFEGREENRRADKGNSVGAASYAATSRIIGLWSSAATSEDSLGCYRVQQ